ncbi:hypothetical protein, partial [Klenkia sp. PcliD-1-E]|uniref:hypothetical protein n=1 Tax=Klenkia sp. PcliD-1-E TaxID=2954492 RepID=UPI0020970D25
VAVGAVALGGGGFAIGRATAPGSTSATTDQQVPGGGQFGTPPDGGQLGTPPDGGQLGTPPGQDGTTDGGTSTDPDI